jgi:NADH-quinone oxidoreductase subunit L
MFHLVTHAFFKALLFLGSGSVIHGMEHGHHHLSHDSHGEPKGEHGEAHPFDPQDMRTMGGLKDRMRITFIVYLVGALALAGIPPLAGFWSKDEILSHGNTHNIVVYIILTLAAVCTAFYMGRQLKMVFWGEPRHEAARHASESPPVMWVPLVVLAILAFFGGLLNLPHLSGPADQHAEGIFLMLESWLEHSIGAFHLSEEGILHLPHTPTVLNPVVALVSTGLAVLALGAAFFLVYGRRPRTAEERDPLQGVPGWGFFNALPINFIYMRGIVPAFNWLAQFLGDIVDGRFWHDFFHDRVIRDGFHGWARFTSDILDAQAVDNVLVNGAGRTARRLADLLRMTQSGYARTYVLGILVGVVALLAYFIFLV